MAFLRGVETALAVAVLVDLIKSVTPRPLHPATKLVLVLMLAGAGAAVLTPPPSAGNWRDVVAAMFVGAGLAPLVHELHSVLATFVDGNIRKVIARSKAAAQPARRTSRQIPTL